MKPNSWVCEICNQVNTGSECRCGLFKDSNASLESRAQQKAAKLKGWPKGLKAGEEREHGGRNGR